jgi:hypothetical protein
VCVIRVQNEDPIESLREDYELYLKKQKIDGPTWETLRDEQDSGEHHENFEAFLLQLPLDLKELGDLKYLCVDGDHFLLSWVWPRWFDGADGGYFRVRNLDGIEFCSSLESLSFDIIENCSLKPLTRLNRLKSLSASATSGFQDIESLLNVRSLEKLDLSNLSSNYGKNKREWKKVISQLREKGVNVDAR